MRRHQPAVDGPDVPLLATQAAIWYAQVLDPGSPGYNTGDAVEITGPLDAGLFERALRQTVDEADALHALVTAEDGTPRQRLRPGRPWPLHRLDLSTAADPDGEAEDWMRADLARPVDLAEGPLFAQALIRLGADRHLWYRRVHHLAVDAYALTLIGGRVAELYTALATGAAPGPRTFATPAEVAAEESAYRAGEQYAADREFWRERLAGTERLVPLGGATRGRGARHGVRVVGRDGRCGRGRGRVRIVGGGRGGVRVEGDTAGRGRVRVGRRRGRGDGPQLGGGRLRAERRRRRVHVRRRGRPLGGRQHRRRGVHVLGRRGDGRLGRGDLAEGQGRPRPARGRGLRGRRGLRDRRRHLGRGVVGHRPLTAGLIPLRPGGPNLTLGAHERPP
ncbi:condensation domain-containing protein [Kitasatospora sp. NPDC004240]